ncbi:MAG: diaminopimelate decarboxylase [Burkholderiales bacterium]
MNAFSYRNDELCAEAIPLAQIAAQYGTPCYVYSRTALEQTYREFVEAFKSREHLICYAVKANSNLAILNLFARLGSGFDVVSGGELQRVLAAGGSASKVVFSGVGKSEQEIALALSSGILCFNVESESELKRLDMIASEMNLRAPVSLRVNPDVDPNTHRHIATGLKQNKFGIAFANAEKTYLLAKTLDHIRITGIDCHIGSQLTEVSPFIRALKKLLALIKRLQQHGIAIGHLDIGGGLGIRYRDESPPSFSEYAEAVLTTLRPYPQRLIVEPGRALVGNAGLLLTKVEYLKHSDDRNFAIVDAAMNDLMRPALYNAYHEIVPVRKSGAESKLYSIAGPVCESADLLGEDRSLALAEGDLLAILSAGAYGMSMSSNYNTRPRPAEVMVNGEGLHLIRAREQISDLFAREKTLPVSEDR